MISNLCVVIVPVDTFAPGAARPSLERGLVLPQEVTSDVH